MKDFSPFRLKVSDHPLIKYIIPFRNIQILVLYYFKALLLVTENKEVLLIFQYLQVKEL